jgi:uncharacterized protein YaaN involved in tellurite resistance
MKKDELIIYDEGGNIVSCNFQRIDFENPSSILSYCDDVKNEISNILESTAKMSIENKRVVIDEDLINNITGFEDSLDDSEKQASKKQLPVVSSAKKFLSNIGIKKFQKEERDATYYGRYQDYITKIDEVIKAVEEQKQASLADIELRKTITEEMKPLVDNLEEMINVGTADRDNFEKHISSLKTEEQTQDVIYQIQYEEQLLEVLNCKLNELQKSLVLYKTQIQQYRLQQSTEMQAVMSADSYIKDTAPILKAQGSVMVFNREQTTRLTALQSLNQASNEALTQNATSLSENAETAVELSLNNGIAVSTVEELDAALKKGIEVVQNGRKLKREQIEEEKRALSQLNSDLNSYQQEVLNLIDDKQVIANLLEDSTSKPKTYRKKR